MFAVHLCNRKKNCLSPQNILKFCAIHLYHYLRQICYVTTLQAYSYTGTRCKVKKKMYTKLVAAYTSWFGRADNAACRRETSFNRRVEIVCFTDTSSSVKEASPPCGCSAWVTWPWRNRRTLVSAISIRPRDGWVCIHLEMTSPANRYWPLRTSSDMKHGNKTLPKSKDPSLLDVAWSFHCIRRSVWNDLARFPTRWHK